MKQKEATASLLKPAWPAMSHVIKPSTTVMQSYQLVFGYRHRYINIYIYIYIQREKERERERERERDIYIYMYMYTHI